MNILICFIPFIIIQLFITIKKDKMTNIIHIITCGLLSVVISLLVGMIIATLCPMIEKIRILYVLIIGATNEELVKFLMIKNTRPKSNRQILINSIYIGLIFRIAETLLITENTGQIISRTLKSGHIFYQTIMALFLVKANNDEKNKKIYTALALIVPIMLHASHNILLEHITSDALTIIFAIIFYMVPIISILTVKNNNTDSQEPKKVNKFLHIFELIFVSIISIFVIFSNIINDPSKLSNTKIINDKIEVKVNEAKIVKNDLLFKEITAIEINVTIKNNSAENFEINNYDWKIIDTKKNEQTYMSFYFDNLEEVKANEEVTGNIYFEADSLDNHILVYQKSAIDNSAKQYKFKIVSN